MPTSIEFEIVLDSLKLSLGRLERAATRVEKAVRLNAHTASPYGAAPHDAMTPDWRGSAQQRLHSAIESIDLLLKDGQNV